MTLRRQLAFPRLAWSAREILLALIEVGDVERLEDDGGAVLRFRAGPELLEALMVFDAAAREDDRLDEAAPLLGFGGSGAP